MAYQGGSAPAPAVLTPSQIKAPGDLSYARLDKANAPQHVFPNALINASFDHWQRGPGPFTASGAAFVYGPDRWSTYNIGANGQATVTRRALAFGDWPSQSRFSAIFGCSGHSAAGDGMVGRQLIESVDTHAGRRVVVKAGIRLVSGAAGSKVALEMEQAFGTGGSANVTFGPAAGQQQQITLTGVLTPFSAIFDVPSMSGKIIGTANDALTLNIWLSAGSNFNARTGNLGLQSIQIELVDVEVKEIKPGYGDSFPGFERIPLDIDLYRAKRFYEVLGYSVVGYNTTGGTIAAVYQMVSKRVNPVLITSVVYRNNVQTASETIDSIFTYKFRFYCSAAATGTLESSGNITANSEF